MDKQTNTNRNLQIDGIRAILCFLIVVFHVFQRYYELRFSIDFSNYYLPNAFSVVSIFFVISGFFVKMEGYKKFWFSKLVNLIIPYLICITFLLVIQLVSNGHFSFIDVLANYTIFPLMAGIFQYIDGAHWYIVYLLFFFTVIFVLDVFEKRFYKKTFISEVLLVLIAFASFAFFFINSSNVLIKVLKICFNSGFLFFIFGIFGKKFIFNQFSLFYKSVCLLLLFLSLVVMSNYGITTFILWIILFVLLVLSVFQKINFLANKFFVFIGSGSFWIYLLHEVPAFLLCDLLIRFGIPHIISSLICLIIVFFIPIFVSLLYKKIIRKLRKIIVPVFQNDSHI